MNLEQNRTTLSLAEQAIGGRRYLWFTRINAISFGCLAESTLILYAIKNGADDFLIGLMTSFLYLTMPFMFLGKRLVGRIGAAHTYAFSWIFRNISAALMITVPYMMNPSLGLGLLTISSFSFFSFRSIGLTANTPILGEITNESNRGKFISQVWINFNIFILMTIASLIFLLTKYDNLHMFQWIFGIGSLTGLISSTFIFRVPETLNPRLSGRQPLRESITYLFAKNTKVKKLLVAWTASTISIMLITPFAMVALKKGYLVSDHNALFFALMQIIGEILAALINKQLLDRVGPCPMLIIYSSGFLLASMLWAMTPDSLFDVYLAAIFILIGICRAGSLTSLSHYFLIVVHEKERVGTAMLIYMISGTIAGLSGALIGGGLLKLLKFFNVNGLEVYRIYFVIIFTLLIPLILVIRRIERVTDWRIRDVLGVIVSFRDIRALFTLQRFDKNK